MQLMHFARNWQKTAVDLTSSLAELRPAPLVDPARPRISGFAGIIHAAPFRALRHRPQEVRRLDVRPMLREEPRGPQPTALVALDLDHLVRVVGI